MNMPSTNSKKEAAISEFNLRDYNSIAGLKANQLKKLCAKYNVDVKFPKKARIVLLCHCLGISTSGHVQSTTTEWDNSCKHLTASQKNELLKLSPAYMCRLTDWKKDIVNIPDIEVTSVKKYLVNTDVINVSDARTYKISRPYALQQFVHSLMYCENGDSDFSIIRAQCNSSQSANPDEVKVVFVVIDKFVGEPYGGFCTCTVGISERCGHVGAVLFKLAELQATGAVEGPSCTDILCKWAEPKCSKAEPTVFQDLKIKKTDAPLRRTIDDYGQKSITLAPPTYDQVTELRALLIEATHNTGQYCPAVHVLNCERFKPPNSGRSNTTSSSKIVSELPDILPYDSDAIVPSKELNVTTTPVLIAQLVTEKFNSVSDSHFNEAADKLYTKATHMEIDLKEVDNITRGQASNIEWHEQRRGAITATKFSSVMKIIEKKKSGESLVRDIIDTKPDNLKNVPAIKWGRKYERNARQAYVNKYKRIHKDLEIEDHGLLIYKQCNFIRGSPDGIATCKCHGRILVEVKCPYSARMMTVAEGVSLGKIKYLETVNGQLKLKENSCDGYYAQIQGLMGITNIQRCNLVVWTTRDMVLVNVSFNKCFFEDKLVPACKTFFRQYIVPKLLLSDTGLESTTGHSDEKEETACSSICETDPEIYSATPITISPTLQDIDHPSKRKRVKSPRKASKMSLKLPKSPQLVIPTASSSTVKQTTSAKLILAESTIYKCSLCNKNLPDDNVAPDNSDASVGCDCPNCAGCDVWMCWPCARYDQDLADSGCNWYCLDCTRECDIVH